MARSQGGGWCPTNGLAQCSRDHALAHQYPEMADEAGVRLVHRGPSVVPAEVPVWRWHQDHGVFGWWLLELAGDGGPHVVVAVVDPGVWGLPVVPGFAGLVSR